MKAAPGGTKGGNPPGTGKKYTGIDWRGRAWKGKEIVEKAEGRVAGSLLM